MKTSKRCPKKPTPWPRLGNGGPRWWLALDVLGGLRDDVSPDGEDGDGNRDFTDEIGTATLGVLESTLPSIRISPDAAFSWPQAARLLAGWKKAAASLPSARPY